MEDREYVHGRMVKDPGQRPVPGKIAHVLWRIIAVLLCVLGSALVIFGAAAGIFSLKAKNYVEKEIIANADFTLEGIKLNQSSFILAYDKEEEDYVQICQLYAAENRVWADYEEIPQEMIDAVVSIEDKRFFEHDGVDWKRTLGACANMFMGSGSTYGGSTITQQLIKNLSQDDEVTVRRKLLEIFRALEFEKHYTKEEILEWYLNTIYLGEGAYGVRSAAKVYFGKELSELTVKEAACIVGITNNPSLYDPYIYPENNENRTMLILGEMREQGKLSEQEYQQAAGQKLVFGGGSSGNDETHTCPNCGFTGTLSEYTKQDGKYICPQCETVQDIEEEETSKYYTYFEDTVIRDVIDALMEKYGYSYNVASQMVTTGGYQIYSTIDLEAQEIVDEVYEDPENVAKTYSSQQLQSAIIVIDNESGDIVAMSGGVGEKEGSLTLNRATQSLLSPGSAIKPITVYGPALAEGVITPSSVYEDSPYTQINGKNWPKNETGTYSGKMSVQKGLALSLNTIAVKVLADLTPEKSYEFATEKLGVENLVVSEVINGKTYTDIALAPLGLGQLTHGITVREMANAYATYPNEGTYRKARTFIKVVDSEGKVILDNTQEQHTAMSKRAAYYMTTMLQYAVQNGTGTLARMKNMAVAGKTGTTSDNRDRWFAGYTPYYTAVVWCGYDEPEEIRLVVNKNPALMLWKSVMDSLHEDLESAEFSLPQDEEMITVSVCSETGLLATSSCTSQRVTVFASDAPKTYCSGHETAPKDEDETKPTESTKPTEGTEPTEPTEPTVDTQPTDNGGSEE